MYRPAMSLGARLRTAGLCARQCLPSRARRCTAARGLRPLACAASNGSGGDNEKFTVTTPLYYSNAGAWQGVLRL